MTQAFIWNVGSTCQIPNIDSSAAHAHILQPRMRESAMNVQGTPGTPRGHRPPYVSYPSFKTLIGEFHDHDIPTRIDRSVLTRFSGIVGTQLLTALRFLSLIDERNAPTDRLRELVAAHGTNNWSQALLAILHEEYGPMFQLDLAAATSSHFAETFRKAYPGSDA